jgi:hypothetical protein
MTLLHETVHYGDYLDNIKQEGKEPGFEFEIGVWGRKIKNDDGSEVMVMRFFPDKYEDTQSLINAINQWLNSDASELLPTIPE